MEHSPPPLWTKIGFRNHSVLQWRSLLPILLCTMGLLISSCGSDNSTGPGDDMQRDDNHQDPPPAEDTTEVVSFSQDIQPIFNTSCAKSGCHDSQTQQNGVNLSSYDDAINSEGIQYGKKVIIKGSPGDSPLVDKIEENPEKGVRMPYDGPALTQTNIDSIKAWIEDGAPNN